MGSLGCPAVPKSRGVRSTPKSYVGHIGVDTNCRTCPEPSRTCTLFAPIMSVHIFGHFVPFSIFLARHAPSLAPPCTPVAWTSGLYSICSLCILVRMTHIQHGWTNAHTHRELGQGEYGPFCHFGTCGPNSGQHHVMAYGDFWTPSTCGPPLDSHQVPHRALSPLSKPPWRYTLRENFIFGSFMGMPIWDPKFSPPCCQMVAPYLYAHLESISTPRLALRYAS